MSDPTPSSTPRLVQYVIGGIFAVLLLGTGLKLLMERENRNSYAPVVFFLGGGLLLIAFFDRVTEIHLSPKGLTAKLSEVKQELAKVQEKLSDLHRMQLETAYQINHDLLKKRCDAYGNLWKR
jgi:UDP-N-acetylmuramyl pentapeptide phosphotransferase/UDP-N-acetylglucosamine-1-phosphate transferase